VARPTGHNRVIWWSAPRERSTTNFGISLLKRNIVSLGLQLSEQHNRDPLGSVLCLLLQWEECRASSDAVLLPLVQVLGHDF